MKQYTWRSRILIPAICMLVVAMVPRSATGADPTTPVSSITYKTLFNGQEAPEEGRTVVDMGGGIARIRSLPAGALIAGAPLETGYIDYTARKTHQVADLRNASRCTMTTTFDALPKLEITEDRGTILGLPCIRAHTVIRSNQIDVWFTRDAQAVGSPAINLVVPDGLVLRIVRNGNSEILADRIDSIPGPIRLPSSWGDSVDAAAYRARVTESYITTLAIFEREKLSFGNEIDNPPDSAAADVFHFAGGTIAARRVALPEITGGATVFAELVQYSNGDAYDRTGSIFVILPDGAPTFLDALREDVSVLPVTPGRDGRSYQGIAAVDSYVPPVEMVRFITPFGVRFYNDQVRVHGIAWEDSIVYKMDVSDVLSRLHGAVWIGAFIGNYDKGGHMLSLRLRYHPDSREASGILPRKTWIFPLFNTVNVMEMAGQEYARIFAQDTLTVEFNAPAGLKNCALRYITTGHGGWENGDRIHPEGK